MITLLGEKKKIRCRQKNVDCQGLEDEDYKMLFSSVQFSCLVVSDSWRPHDQKHARPPCPSPTPGIHPNPRVLSRWCHPTILSSVVSSCCPQSFLWVFLLFAFGKLIENSALTLKRPQLSLTMYLSKYIYSLHAVPQVMRKQGFWHEGNMKKKSISFK